MQLLNNWLLKLKSSDTRIRNIFFDLIQKNKGSITVIDFAVATDMSGTDAKKILEQFAIEFDATFDVTEEGQVIYLFPTISKHISEKALSEPKTNSPIIEPKDSNESSSDREFQEQAKSPFDNSNNDLNRQIEDINNDVKRKVDNINKDIKRKMEDINKF